MLWWTGWWQRYFEVHVGWLRTNVTHPHTSHPLCAHTARDMEYMYDSSMEDEADDAGGEPSPHSSMQAMQRVGSHSLAGTLSGAATNPVKLDHEGTLQGLQAFLASLPGPAAGGGSLSAPHLGPASRLPSDGSGTVGEPQGGGGVSTALLESLTSGSFAPLSSMTIEQFNNFVAKQTINVGEGSNGAWNPLDCVTTPRVALPPVPELQLGGTGAVQPA